MNNQLFKSIYEELNKLVENAKNEPSRFNKSRAWKAVIYKCDVYSVDFYELVKSNVLAELSVEKPVLSVVNTEISVTGVKPKRVCKNCNGEIDENRRVGTLYCSDNCKADYHKKK